MRKRLKLARPVVAIIIALALLIPVLGVGAGPTVSDSHEVIPEQTAYPGQFEAEPVEPVELVGNRTRTSKTYSLGDGKYALNVSIGSIHYKDDLSDPEELWKEIETGIVSSNRTNWDWEVSRGHWTLLIAEDTTVALGRSGHWIGFRYAGFGYLDWATKDYVVLGTPNSVTPVVTGNTITWSNLFGGVDLEYVYDADGFKENLYITQSARDWLVAHPPSSYGLDNQTTYLVGGLECDWQSAYPAETIDGTPVNWSNVNEFVDQGVFWRHPITSEIVTALPIGKAGHPDIYVGNWTDIRYRFYTLEENHYLLFGARVLELNSFPSGTIVLDPTVNEQVGSGYDDAHEKGDSTFSNSDSSVETFSRTSPDSQFYKCAGYRFQSVAIPQGATIDVAYMQVHCVATSDPLLTIYGHDVDDADDFNDNQHIISETYRPRTSASAVWDDDGDLQLWQNTPSITSVVEEVVGRGSWSSGNDMVMLFIASTAANFRQCYSNAYDGVPGNAAKLYVEYTEAAAGTPYSWGQVIG